MKKALLVVLVGVFVLGMAGTALAATPSVIATDGSSAFTYADLKDGSAKYSGGYAAFDGGAATGKYFNATALTTITPDGNGNVYANPHGGYRSTSNKCKVCHAVHRAEGAYYLLRADSQSDACDYCHIGGSAHSNKVVYDLNPAGTNTTNGHTMGAFMVPDSSTNQQTQPVTLSGTDENGAETTETINVRSYDEELIQLFRFAAHHSHGSPSRFMAIGPNALSCFSCHQPHNAPTQVWQPMSFDASLTQDGANIVSGYKLLRRSPSGSWAKADTTAQNGFTADQATATVDGVEVTAPYGGMTNNNGGWFVPQNRVVKVPETTLTAGTNYSSSVSNEKAYTENGVSRAMPTWIAQNVSGFEAAGTGPSEDPATVNQFTLSVWCADCHNLNIGASVGLTKEELGFKAHTERTHPAPFIGSHDGPAQCYSCHRTDLSVANNTADPSGYGMGQAGVAASGGSSCGRQCHYGTNAYRADRAARNSDFPHSGSATDIKLLGSYTTSMTAGSGSTTGYNVFKSATINESNLDAVCIRCHPGIGVHN